MTYASAPPEEWYTVTWQDPRREVYDQLRLAKFIGGDYAVVTIVGRPVRVARASLTDDGGTRVECGDGPLWVTVEPGQSAQA